MASTNKRPHPEEAAERPSRRAITTGWDLGGVKHARPLRVIPAKAGIHRATNEALTLGHGCTTTVRASRRALRALLSMRVGG
jgi:hypothetical protein